MTTNAPTRFLRTNYRRAGGHFDYGNVIAILNFTVTGSTDASGLYYTQLANYASTWLQATASGEVISGMVYVQQYVGTHYTSVWGSADADDSILAVVHGWLTYSATPPSQYIAWHALWASATLSLLYSGAFDFAFDTFVFVVSR